MFFVHVHARGVIVVFRRRIPFAFGDWGAKVGVQLVGGEREGEGGWGGGVSGAVGGEGAGEARVGEVCPVVLGLEVWD